MEWFRKFLGNIDYGQILYVTSTIFVVLGCLAILYSIIAGIWGYAPSENFNWRIFGTGVVSIVLGVIGLYIEEG